MLKNWDRYWRLTPLCLTGSTKTMSRKPAQFKLKREILKAYRSVPGNELEVDLTSYHKKIPVQASTTLNKLKVLGRNLWSEVSYFQWVQKMQLLKTY